ncbi:hypothetical protein, partial [uncultured Allobaculum sp.]|uniref:hypothetical protein n=1 Tax=uncultured Allobaculum sp. TaxID=1187017 RepID=UPI00259BB3B2
MSSVESRKKPVFLLQNNPEFLLQNNMVRKEKKPVKFNVDSRTFPLDRTESMKIIQTNAVHLSFTSEQCLAFLV